MHELSLCEDLLEQVLTIAKQNKAKYVETITLDIGSLAGVEPVLIENAFSILKMATLAENAKLIIQTPPIIVECVVCGQQSTVSANNLVCLVCQSNETQLVHGDELILVNLTLFTAS